MRLLSLLGLSYAAVATALTNVGFGGKRGSYKHFQGLDLEARRRRHDDRGAPGAGRRRHEGRRLQVLGRRRARGRRLLGSAPLDFGFTCKVRMHTTTRISCSRFTKAI